MSRAFFLEQLSGGSQSFCQQMMQALKLGREAPFCATRSREAAMRVSRSWSLSPEAVSGGCPSSVRVLRTAKQYWLKSITPRIGTGKAAFTSVINAARSASLSLEPWTRKQNFSRHALAKDPQDLVDNVRTQPID